MINNYKYIIVRLNNNLIRKYSIKSKPKIVPDETVLTAISNEIYKPKRHPGIIKPTVFTLPDSLVQAVANVIEDQPLKTLVAESKRLFVHLRYKVPPMERPDVKELTHKVRERVVSRMQDVEIDGEEDQARYNQTVKDKVAHALRLKVYNWGAVDYDAHNSLLYLFARLAPDYAVLMRIFAEISARDAEFKPRSLFDFGSGVGSATWAANQFWKDKIFEYFNVDASREMNDLAQLLLQDGKRTKAMSIKGVFYRQFLPATNTSYDLVISAYSLMELPSRQSRLETVLNLWNKTQKYLVIVEQGSNAGFKVVNEVRDYILHTKNVNNPGFVFSPCPHDNVCPRFLQNDSTPCNFEVNYFTLPLGERSERKSERYCYIVLKKGERHASDPQWPRVVRETLVRSKHTICRVCTSQGELDEVIFTKSKHGKPTYHCARSTKWGDLLPVKIEKRNDIDEDEAVTEINGKSQEIV